MIEFSAHFDGKNICPDEPIWLAANVPLRVVVNEVSDTENEVNGPISLFDRLEAEVGLVDGPTDWAAEHDHYLHGARKKPNKHAE